VILKSYLLVINCFPNSFQQQLSAYDLLIFALGSLVLISFLNFYYNKIPKSNTQKSSLDSPIYQTKDILLQSNSSDANFVIAKSITSTWVKLLAFVLILIFAFTPFQDFLVL